MSLREKVSPLLNRCGCGSGDPSGNRNTLEIVGVDTMTAPREPSTRRQWSSPTEFLLTCIGYSVGLGNVWRFPYLCYTNGGGAFLIPYIIMMCLIGMPLLFMEYSFGQFFGVGGLSIFKKICPLFQGIGYGYMILNGLVCVYYNVIIALALYYLFGSFTSVLPWATCGNPWNTPLCGGPSAMNNTNATFIGHHNATNIGNLTWNSPTDEFFRLNLLMEFEGIDIENLGSIRWHLCLCLLLAWILVIIFVSRGIQSTGKVAYFTATFPYLMLTVLVVRGVTLPGAAKGIRYFVEPKWDLLKQPSVWFKAAGQLFYSTNLAWGGMITMASYNNFNHNCYRDAIMINCVSFFTSIYAGFAVFSIIGYMAESNNQLVEDVIKSGPGLAFVAYPRALSLMPLSPLWTALFFFMLFLLGIGSQMVLIETVVTGFCDEFPVLRRTTWTRLLTTIAFCIFFCLLGIAMTTQGGMYVLTLMDTYGAGICVLIIAIIECIVINWIYGNARFSANVKEMLDYYPNFWWRLCWSVISPVLILGVLVSNFISYQALKYNSKSYPLWADLVGWLLTMSSIIPIFAIAAYKLWKAPGQTLMEKLRYTTKPQEAPQDIPICPIEEPLRSDHLEDGEMGNTSLMEKDPLA